MILALLVPPLVTLGTFALATAVAQAVRRRPLVKSAFNAGQVLIAAGLGLAVSRCLAAPSDPLTAAQIAAVLVGAGVYFVINTLLVAGVMVSMGTTWPEFTSDLPVQVTLAGAGALAGVVLALAIQGHLWAVALAIPGTDRRAPADQRPVRGAARPHQDEGTVRGHPGGQPGAAAAGGAGHDPGVGAAAAPQPAGRR